MRGGAAAAVTGAVLVVVLAGCAPAPACSGTQWSSLLEVSAVGPGRASVADMRLCSGPVCSRPSEPASDGSRSFDVLQVGDELWVFDVGRGLPDPVTLTLTDRSGELLLQREYSVGWRVVDEPAGEGCGWRAEPKELSIDVPEPRGSVFGTR